MNVSEIKKLWRKHGGGQHGPRVEIMTIPEANFKAFVDDLIAHSKEPE